MMDTSLSDELENYKNKNKNLIIELEKLNTTGLEITKDNIISENS